MRRPRKFFSNAFLSTLQCCTMHEWIRRMSLAVTARGSSPVGVVFYVPSVEFNGLRRTF